MLRSYLLVASRNLLRNKAFSFINIFGLAIGLAVSFLIYEYVAAEKTYDGFHANADRLYRLPISQSGSLATQRPSAGNHPALGPALKRDFPEVEDFTRLVRASLLVPASTVTYAIPGQDPKVFNEEKVYFADAAFMTMFSFPLLDGDRATALATPKSIVITKDVAQKYFGNESAIGKTLSLNKLDCTVTAVLDNLPQNSHLQFDMLLSFSSLGNDFGNDNWRWPEYYNYILLRKEASATALEAKFPAFMEKYLAPVWKEFNFKSQLLLQPIRDIHLKSNLSLEQSPNGSERTIYFLTALGIFVLVIAWINYINLSTAKSLERSKEVGLRKVSGASRAQLVIQFFSDAVVINGLSVVFAIALLSACAPYFEDLCGKDISSMLTFSGTWSSFSFWAPVFAILFAGVFLVGLYPALVLSSYNPALVLKGKFSKSSSGILLRKGLVGFQYVLSLFLLASTITISQQLSFMEDQDLGYQKDQVLVVRAAAIFDSTYSSQLSTFRNKLLQNPEVKSITKSGEIPGHALPGRNSVRREGKGIEENVSAFMVDVDDQYFTTYGMTLLAGRNIADNERFQYSSLPVFSMRNLAYDFRSSTPDTRNNRIMINEDLARQLGFSTPTDALHQKLQFRMWDEFTGEIVGVVKNYHQQSLKEGFEPILYVYPSYDSWLYYSVRLDGKNLQETIDKIKSSYTSSFPGNAFEYYFLDEHFNVQYKSDQQFAGIFQVFTVLTIVVACLGLLGLSLYSTTQRMKEIGIRKVLGASVSSILILFSRDTIRLLLIAGAITFPLVYLAADRWLSGFAFHIGLQWQIFIIPMALLFAISVATVIFISLRSALTSPSVSLKSE